QAEDGIRDLIVTGVQTCLFRSLISLPGDDVTDHAAIARIAALFGLHAFCSAGVVAENGELLGSLEMYSCVQRRPSAREFQLIKRSEERRVGKECRYR